jgi:hypothetical protein
MWMFWLALGCAERPCETWDCVAGPPPIHEVWRQCRTGGYEVYARVEDQDQPVSGEISVHEAVPASSFFSALRDDGPDVVAGERLLWISVGSSSGMADCSGPAATLAFDVTYADGTGACLLAGPDAASIAIPILGPWALRDCELRRDYPTVP